MTDEQGETYRQFVDFFARPARTDILRTPDEYGMAYEDVTFPATDGTEIKGWFIPADSDRLLIMNHFLNGNRYGYPGHKIPNDLVGFEVNYVQQHKTLHDAGYNILAGTWVRAVPLMTGGPAAVNSSIGMSSAHCATLNQETIRRI